VACRGRATGQDLRPVRQGGRRWNDRPEWDPETHCFHSGTMLRYVGISEGMGTGGRTQSGSVQSETPTEFTPFGRLKRSSST
jgi:hypothetical protein